MAFQIYNTIDDLLNALAEFICEKARDSINSRGQFNFVLSGGNSPRRLYELLASKDFRHKIEWGKTYFFFGDERFVPEDDLQRNSVMAEESLFEPLKIKKSHIFTVDTSGSPESAASFYKESIERHFDNKRVEFDFILLGLGDNAHTASLFPNTSVLEENKATVEATFVKEVDMYRITMTAPLINQAKNIAFLVYGVEKADAVYHVLRDIKDSPLLYPARLIINDQKKVMWFLDKDSASRL